jgi:hypothetical protein
MDMGGAGDELAKMNFITSHQKTVDGPFSAWGYQMTLATRAVGESQPPAARTGRCTECGIK